MRLTPLLFAATFSALFPNSTLLAQETDTLPPTLSSEERDTWNGSVFRIEDSRSRVKIASVNLTVSDLKPVGDNLVGEYTIEVPLMKAKNDKGRIVLPLNRTMEELGSTGGVLRGQAISYKEGTTPNTIKCVIIPNQNQDIRLEITTDDRTLRFESRYEIIAGGEDS